MTRKKPIALVSPFTNPTNSYNELQKKLLNEAGFEVIPFSIRTILSARVRHLFSRRNIIAINWMEARLFRWRNGHPAISLPGVGIFAFYLVVLIVARARVVQFVHDEAVHDTEGRLRRFSAAIIKVIGRVADARVVHDPASADRYGATYLPHPLIGTLTTTCAYEIPDATPFVVLGAIRPYKCIETLIDHWPPPHRLLIAGRADPVYAEHLQKRITQSGKGECITLRAAFLSDEEFSARLRAARALVLPHRISSALVSSAVFEGLGRVPFLIARSSPFNLWLASEVSGVYCFREDEELTYLVKRIAIDGELATTSDAFTIADALFGWRNTSMRYRDFFAALAVQEIVP